MKGFTAYIVPADLLASGYRPGAENGSNGTNWHAQGIPGDPTKSLLFVNWGEGHGHPNGEALLEARDGVLPLGLPWEPLPAEAVPLLASFQDPAPSLTVSGAIIAGAPTVDATPAATVSVGRALKTIGIRIV
jgi:hypothetical protein